MAEAGSPARPDFFVSYTEVDRGWAEWIAWQLEAKHAVAAVDRRPVPPCPAGLVQGARAPVGHALAAPHHPVAPAPIAKVQQPLQACRPLGGRLARAERYLGLDQRVAAHQNRRGDAVPASVGGSSGGH